MFKDGHCWDTVGTEEDGVGVISVSGRWLYLDGERRH